MQADHVSGLPELVERTGATAYLPEGAGVEFDHHALADGEVVELGNTEVRGARDARPRARAPRLPGHRPHARRRAVARADRRRAAGRRRRPAGPARARRAHASRRWRGALYRSLTERLLTLPDHLALYPAHYSGLGLRARAVGQPDLHRRLRAPRTTARCGFDSRGRVRRRAARRHPAGPGAPGRDRRRQPRRPAAEPERGDPAARSSWGCARTSRSSRCWSRSTRSSARWSASSARPCR